MKTRFARAIRQGILEGRDNDLNFSYLMTAFNMVGTSRTSLWKSEAYERIMRRRVDAAIEAREAELARKAKRRELSLRQLRSKKGRIRRT